jgi:hypothetical protein
MMVRAPEVAIDQPPTTLPAVIIGEIVCTTRGAEKPRRVTGSRGSLKFHDDEEDPQKN